MPVRQQYFIAFAIIGLIAVMVAFAIFDYASDTSRYAEQTALHQQEAATPAGAVPYGQVATNSQCLNCGWLGACPRNRLCPNCARPLSPLRPQAQPGIARVPGDTQNAGFLWLESQPTARPGLRGVLSCPSCPFSMSSKYDAISTPIRCPKCPAYLVHSGQSAAAGQSAGFTPGLGRGTGGVLNPYCPVR